MTEESLAFERLRQRAVELGERGDGGAWFELLPLLRSAAPRVRRAAASAVGKLVMRDRSVKPVAVTPLFLLAMEEKRDQVREYLFKALVHCASDMSS